VIRVHLGDTIHFTLTNASTVGIQHSIDFRAAMTPWADLPVEGSTTLEGNYQPVNPGDTKTFDCTNHDRPTDPQRRSSSLMV